MVKSITVEGNELLSHVDRRVYDTEGFVDYQKLRKKLHISLKTLAAAVGRTPRAIEKNPRSEEVQKVLRKIAYAIVLLKEMQLTDAEILIWFKAPNPVFGGLSPWEVIVNREVDAVINYLMDIRQGALT